MAFSGGYITEIEYTFGYYSELNPARIGYALTQAGLKAPKIKNVCELGFGQGLTLAINAAAHPEIQFWGTDFNPAQVGFAQDLIDSSGSSAKVFDESFAEFCARDDLPQFDVIALHGIWTWISNENRSIIVDFIRRKLAVGGVVYMSYNTLPGWSAPAPIRHLMKQYDVRNSAKSASYPDRIAGAIAFMERLVAIQPAYSRVYPGLAERIGTLRTQDRNYQAHEYLNDEWRPMYFSEVHDWLSPAKIDYVTTVALAEQQNSVIMTAPQIELVEGLHHPVFRETVRDVISGSQFRRDLWMRGARKLATLDHVEALRKHRYILLTSPADVPLKINSHQGEVELQAAVYRPILDTMQGAIRSFAEIEAAVRPTGITIGQVASALALLIGMGNVVPVQPEEAAAKAKPFTDKLNRALLNLSRTNVNLGFLASPQTGGGIPVPRTTQLFLKGYLDGLPKPDDWAEASWRTMAEQGQSIVKEGKLLETPEENLAELKSEAQVFEKTLPMFKLLGVI